MYLEHDDIDTKEAENGLALLKSIGFKEDDGSEGDLNILTSIFVFIKEDSGIWWRDNRC